MPENGKNACYNLPETIVTFLNVLFGLTNGPKDIQIWQRKTLNVFLSEVET